MNTETSAPVRGALSGLKVVEFAQVIAGPMAGSFLADLGAEVIHVEDPSIGDPLRTSGVSKDGVRLWWKVSARNKRCVTLDLRQPEGQQVAHELVEWADVMITNFRPPTVRRFGLDWETVHAVNPKLIMLQVSGFGVKSGRGDEPGFGKVGEAMSGVVNITGFPDGPPLHTGFSHADSLTGLMGAYAIQAALYRRSQDDDFRGEWIDLALYDTLFRLIEWQVIAYDQTGEIPSRHGNKLAVSPAAVINMYLTGDGDWITVTSGTPRSVQKCAALVGEPDADYLTVDLQTQHGARLDGLLKDWIAARNTETVLAEIKAAGVVASTIYSMKDITEDPTYRERGSIIELQDEDLGPVRMQGVVPQMTNYPGVVDWTGKKLGDDNTYVYEKLLGHTPEDLDGLRARKVI